MEHTKLCIILNDGVIPELNNIRGPITQPISLTKAQIVSMVNRRMSVYEVNPMNHSEKVRLTFANAGTNNFHKKVVKEKPITVNPYKLPDGRNNTVVEQFNEADTVRSEKRFDKKRDKKHNNNVIPVTRSDF